MTKLRHDCEILLPPCLRSPIKPLLARMISTANALAKIT
jgi:hypothetical protein